MVLVFLLAPQSFAGASKAQQHYNAGEYKSALSEYQEMLAKSPNDARLHYNAGAAAYHANKFDLALKEFQSAAASPDIDLQQQSFYNLGNAEFRLGESNSNVQERMAIWEQAIQHYDAALKLRADDQDAEFNRELVRKRLEELKKEQKQEKQDKKDNKDEEQKDKENRDEQQKQDNQQEQKDEKSEQDQKSKEKDENKSSPQEEEKQQQQDQPQEKKNEEPNDSQPQQKGDKPPDDQQKDPTEGQAEAAQLGKMTPAQAKQLLDAQKGEEKALIFVPPERKSGAQNRTFKDW